jgi:hypothetical protein
MLNGLGAILGVDFTTCILRDWLKIAKWASVQTIAQSWSELDAIPLL